MRFGESLDVGIDTDNYEFVVRLNYFLIVRHSNQIGTSLYQQDVYLRLRSDTTLECVTHQIGWCLQFGDTGIGREGDVVANVTHTE